MIRRHVALAADLAARIRAQPKLELVAPVPFSLVSFRHTDGDEATDGIAQAINETGHSYVTPSVIDDRRFIRVSIGGVNTTAVDVDRLWEVVISRIKRVPPGTSDVLAQD
jgi:aromatic-L-amino-acid decarboxylase